MYMVEVATNDNGVQLVYVKFHTREEASAFVETLLAATDIERPVIWAPNGQKIDPYFPNQ
jgi:hypothetical protein